MPPPRLGYKKTTASVLHALSHTFTLASSKRSQLPGCKVPDREVCMVKTKQKYGPL